MLLYKFRSLQNLEFVLDIILHERLYCASYNQLNDPFEGVFYSFIHATSYSVPWTIPLTATDAKVKKFNSINDLFNEGAEHLKVCSLSKSLDDVRLWAYYADGHKGIAIEIDFPEEDVFKVDYKKSLPEFGSTLLTQPSPIEVLSIKTNHWSYEDEYRIIQKDSCYSVVGNIKSIYVGHRVSDFHLELLKKLVPAHIPIVTTEVDSETISVRPKV